MGKRSGSGSPYPGFLGRESLEFGLTQRLNQFGMSLLAQVYCKQNRSIGQRMMINKDFCGPLRPFTQDLSESPLDEGWEEMGWN